MVTRRFARFGRALAELRWRDALVDLAVVVLGLLIGLQLNGWVDATKRQSEEHGYLLRLRDENRANLLAARRIERSQAENVAELLRITLAGAAPADSAALQAIPHLGCKMLQLPASRNIDTAYRELSDGNKLDILQDRALRARLGREIEQRDFTDSQIAYFRQSYQHYRETLGRFYRFDIARDGTVACHIAFAPLLRDHAARNILAWLYRDQRVVLVYRRAETQATQAVHDRLATLLGGG